MAQITSLLVISAKPKDTLSLSVPVAAQTTLCAAGAKELVTVLTDLIKCLLSLFADDIAWKDCAQGQGRNNCLMRPRLELDLMCRQKALEPFFEPLRKNERLALLILRCTLLRCCL